MTSGSGMDMVATCNNMYDIAGAIKLYLRNQPEPLIPYANYQKILEAVGMH